MTLVRTETSAAPAAVGPYSQAITVSGGPLVYTAGQVAIDPTTGTLDTTSDVAAQTRQVIANLSAVLAASGAELQSVIKTTVFLTSMADFSEMNTVYAAAFGDHRPARSTIAVAALPLGARVEIECVAAVVSTR
ncbi:MAG: reactive intermediate/imine deaminase [Myxococcales bacterium]|nr:reactive intermediate/imine deaminase [Myxococcales bacterium]MCB9521072.1 reactive intermediate/imine deaminase [Myxococcales bacterium]